MYKSTTNFLRSAALTALFFLGLLSVNAAVTYHLDTHPVFDYSYTIEGTANIGAGADLLNNMPQAFWRASTTYKFYSDAAKTQEITTAPSGDCDVYVDYVFDPPFILSNENGTENWLYFRGYSSSDDTWYGYLNGSVMSTDENYHNNDNYKFAFYGDGFNFHFKVKSKGDNNPWMYWNRDQYSTSILGQTTKVEPMDRKDVGWQLYTNTATSDHFSSGSTIVFAHPTTPNFIMEMRDIWNDMILVDISYRNVLQGVYPIYKLDEHNRLVMIRESDSYKHGLRWYGFFATPAQGTNTLWHVTYKIMVYDAETDTYIQEGDDIVKQKDANNLKPSHYLTETEGYTYIYYKDEEMTQEWGANENMPNYENTVVWVLKDQFTTTTWKTICLPVGISDPASIGMKLWEYTSVTTTKSEDKYYSFNLTFDWATEIVEDKPYLYMFDNARKSVVDQFEKRLTNGYYNDFITSGEEPIPVTMIDNSYPEVNVAMTGTFDGFTLTPQVDSTDPFYFYFGYNSKKNTYNFYPVKTKNATIKPFRCYFVAGDVPADGVLGFGMDGSTDGISQMMVSFERNETSKGVYNLNGQLMNANGSTVGLPAGIYVVNGKKVVVK